MKLLQRFFAPEIADLERRLDFAKFQKEQTEFERDAALEKLKASEREYKAEVKAGRKREEAFVNKITILLGVGTNPSRFEETTTTPSAAEAAKPPRELTEQEESVLYARAQEYAEQKHGTDFTQEMVMHYFKLFKEEPDQWLSDN